MTPLRNILFVPIVLSSLVLGVFASQVVQFDDPTCPENGDALTVLAVEASASCQSFALGGAVFIRAEGDEGPSCDWKFYSDGNCQSLIHTVTSSSTSCKCLDVTGLQSMQVVCAQNPTLPARDITVKEIEHPHGTLQPKSAISKRQSSCANGAVLRTLAGFFTLPFEWRGDQVGGGRNVAHNVVYSGTATPLTSTLSTDDARSMGWDILTGVDENVSTATVVGKFNIGGTEVIVTNTLDGLGQSLGPIIRSVGPTSFSSQYIRAIQGMVNQQKSKVSWDLNAAFGSLSLGLTTEISAPTDIHLPTSFAAFGDSFSAGIGSGHFIQQSSDGRDNACARMDGSYPFQLWQLSPFETPIAWTDFYSCSGDVLDNIDAQVARLNGRQVDFATLSISGNDFHFANVVTHCVYPVTPLTGNPIPDYQQNCNDALDAASDAIADETNWAKYREKANLILQTAIRPGGTLYITGYAKFFAPPIPGDACDNLFFLDVFVIGNNLKMTSTNRLAMNNLVDLVNSKIQSEVISQVGHPATVIWVNIDPHFEGRRFCEQANANDPIGRGVNAHNVWFNDIKTNLDETGPWNPSSTNVEVQVWSEWDSAIPDSFDDEPGFGRGIRDKLQQSSTFHPKRDAYQRSASVIFTNVILAS